MNIPVCLKIILIYKTLLKLLFVDFKLEGRFCKGAEYLQNYANMHQNVASGL